MGDDHRRVEIALEKAGEPPSLVIRQTEPWVELDGDLTPNLETTPCGKLGYLLALSFDRIAGRGREVDVVTKPLPLLGWERPVDRADCADVADLGDVHFFKYINDLRHFSGPRHTPTETLPFSSSPTAEGAAVNKTYHDFLEAAYFGRYRVRVPRSKVMKPGLHYRNDPNSMANLTAKPSYHFGPIIDVLPLLNLDWPPSRENHADSSEASELFSKVNDHLDRLGHDNVALVFDGDESSNTIIIMTHFEFIYSNFTVAIHFPDGWLMLDGQHLTENAVCYLSVMERALRLLAHPSVRYVMRQPTPGMAKMSKNRERKGEEPVADMKIVHLTKRIYIDGRPVGGKGGSHASPKPHDREGHYRTRATPLPGWEGPFTPVSGDFKGQVRYRRWFDKTTVNGGAPEEKPGRGHPKAALPKAPQYRVVK